MFRFFGEDEYEHEYEHERAELCDEKMTAPASPCPSRWRKLDERPSHHSLIHFYTRPPPLDSQVPFCRRIDVISLRHPHRFEYVVERPARSAGNDFSPRIICDDVFGGKEAPVGTRG
jgi:hypothetical protein